MDRFEQAFEQFGPQGELVGKRRSVRKHFGKQLRQLRSRLKQPEEIHSAGKPLDDVAEPVQRAVGIARRSDRFEESGEHRLERLLSGR